MTIPSVDLDAKFGPTLSGIMFTTIFTVTLQSSIRSFTCCESLPSSQTQSSSKQKRAERLNLTRSSTTQFLRLLSLFGVLITLCYLLENHPPFPHVSKLYDRDWFCSLLLFLGIASVLTYKENKEKGGNVNSEILNRNQTEEWKGWMQAIFLLYHYYAAAETYNCVRVLITCYIWLTGFGNFSFFYKKADYGLVRLIQMLFRLNFMCLFLCLALGNTYILYYICPLHTFFFLMVYAVMWIGKSVNYGNGIRYKMILLGVGIYFVWDTTLPFFETAHFWLGVEPVIGATNGTMWEWYFRTSLDHWSTFLGMLFALNYPVLSRWFLEVENMKDLKMQVAIKTCLGAPIALIFIWWVSGPYQQEKVEYNASNAYFGCIPLLTYVYFRNVSKTLRGHTLSLLHDIGKTTLETYLLQHHLWLSSNAKSLLVFVPNYPKINFCVVTCFYFGMSRKAYKLTMELRGMLLPDDLSFCLKSVAATAGVLGAFGVLSAIITEGGTSSAGIWTVICLGLFLGIAIDGFTEKRLQVKEPQYYNLPAIFPPAATVVFGLLAAATFEVYADHSASPIEPLPSTCQPLVDKGSWADIHCGEGEASSVRRENSLSALIGCQGKTWGWDKLEGGKLECRFEERNTKNAKYSLKERHVAFVGDSHMRIQYYFLRNLIGDVDPTTNNAYAPYHEDIPTVQIGSTKVSYFWKPFVKDQIDFLVSVKDAYKFDVIIAGAGQWDCKEKTDLDNYSKSVEQIGRLLGEIRRRSPDTGLMWMTPPYVNDARLPDHKKDTMAESMVSKYRDVQILKLKPLELDVLDLFLEAGSLTLDRATDTVDGVHFPSDVYRVLLQIEMQALDWAFRRKVGKASSNGNAPGSMADPILGLYVLAFGVAGVALFDSFMGLSYLPKFLCGGPSPAAIQRGVFDKLHGSLGHLKRRKNFEEMVQGFAVGDEEGRDEEGLALISLEGKERERDGFPSQINARSPSRNGGEGEHANYK
ncbi:hypothetical protein TrVE_jg4057 [Triparma verrucosa]|uniref:Cas1p 10 TM acyl transferase domain-containing protein n=1 Tax=Triparma verrucosa TaxID=1606542 RepID=A0A9W7BE09_9STRA|nr:hypothetical protein TrVE_jg4057 [Triparma verrucosa]